MRHPELQRLGAEYWEYQAETGPTSALLRGDTRYVDRWEDFSRAAEDAKIGRLEQFATAAEALDPATLSHDDQVTRDVLIEEARGEADELRSRTAEFAVSHTVGLHVTLFQIVGQIRLPDRATAEGILVKWSRTPALIDQAVGRLRQGIARDRTPPHTAVARSIEQLEAYLTSPLETDPFASLEPSPDLDETEAASWRERLRDAVRDHVRPAFATYAAALRDEVLPKARPDERSGVRWLPDGEEVYARAIRRYTSLDMAPLDIHRIGRDEITRLEDEYRALGAKVLGTSDLHEIYRKLREDPELRFRDREEIVAAAQAALDRAKAAIPQWFGRLPKADCVMVEIPGPGAEDAPLAFYLPPTTDGSRPGSFFVNTTEPTTRTRYESEALAFHESIPGHHLQLAISQELDDVPEFQRHALMTVFVEGWGLYAERLADEMGLYTGDLSRLGILSFDSWRAGRLVVDTGLHALGWSRQEAIDFLAANSPQALNNIENEVDRYIAWPGQALAYKIGQREIFAVRERAQGRLGDRFDIRGFHDAVLGSGSVPIATMQRIVDEWIGAVEAAS